jgi:hypothetical protein
MFQSCSDAAEQENRTFHVRVLLNSGVLIEGGVVDGVIVPSDNEQLDYIFPKDDVLVIHNAEVTLTHGEKIKYDKTFVNTADVSVFMPRWNETP